MELTTLRSRARKYTHTTSNNYSNSDLDADINIANGEIWMVILEAEGYKNIAGGFKLLDFKSTSGLTAGQLGFNGEYPFPSDALEIVRAEISYDGEYWYPAEIESMTDTTSSQFNEDQINARVDVSERNPKIFVFRDSYFVRPLKTTTGDITSGIKLMVRVRQDSIVADADEPQFESNFHNLIPLKVAQDFYLTYPDKYNPRIDRKVSELESQLISYYQTKIPYNPRLQILREQF